MKILRTLSILLALTALCPAILPAETADQAYQSGLDLDKIGRTQEAIVQYRRAVILNPDHWQAYQALGSALERNGQPTLALDAYTRSLRINPNNAALEKAILPLQQQEILRSVRPAESGGERAVVKGYPSWHKKGVILLGGMSSLAGKDAKGLKSSWSAGGGLFFDFGFKPKWEIQPEVLLVRRGAEATSGGATIEFFTLEAPVLVKYRFMESLRPFVGPRFAYVLSASVRVPDGQDLGVMSDAQILDIGFIGGLEAAATDRIKVEVRLDRSMTSAFRNAQLKHHAFYGVVDYRF